MYFEKLPGTVNYFIGNDPAKWRTSVSHYARVKYEDVYPGMDLVYYGNQRQLEYDFIVSPGADPSAIRLSFDGAKKVEVDDNGDLVLHIDGGEVRLNRPLIYQKIEHERLQINGGYEVVAGFEDDVQNIVTFQVSAYDATRPLIIDPVLEYSTFLGGVNDDFAQRIAVDAAGSAYVTGQTFSTDFPTTAGAFDDAHNGNDDAFVAKLSADGSGLVYVTFLGGGGGDTGVGIAVDAAGSVYFTGPTSAGFPTTAGAFDETHNGGRDAFVAKLRPNGNGVDDLDYATFLGGGSDEGFDNEQLFGIAVDGARSAYIAGYIKCKKQVRR